MFTILIAALIALQQPAPPTSVVVGRAGVVVDIDDNYIKIKGSSGKLYEWELSTDKLIVTINNGDAELKDVKKGDRVLVIFAPKRQGQRDVVAKIKVRRPFWDD